MRFATGGGDLYGDILHLVIPLTPSRNEVDRWHHSRNLRKLAQHRGAMGVGVKASMLMAFGRGGIPRPWANKVMLCAVRCSEQRRRLDVSNVLGGCKAAEDALIATGLVIDDNPVHVGWGFVEDRIRSMWDNLAGPATHLFVAVDHGEGEHDTLRLVRDLIRTL